MVRSIGCRLYLLIAASSQRLEFQPEAASLQPLSGEEGLSPKPLVAASFAALTITSPALGQNQGQVTAPTDAPLPRARFIAGMDGEFRKMDADKNGQLTRTEIEQFQTQQQAAQAATTFFGNRG